MYSKTKWNKQRYFWQLQNHFESRTFSRSNGTITMLGKSEYLFVVLWHGRSCQEMCGTKLWVGKQKRLNNSTKCQLRALTTITSKKKNWNPWETCQKYALKLFWNAFSWHVLDDPIFYGKWTNLHDQSLNGPKLVTNDFFVWSPTFTTQVNTNNIAIWVILQNNGDWDCFRTPTLQEILRTQNQLQGEHCVFSEVIHLFQQVGCARNKLQFHTVQQNQKSFPWMQD